MVKKGCKGSYGMLGKHHSEETKKRISEANKIIMNTPIMKIKISEKIKGNWNDNRRDEYSKRMINNNPMKDLKNREKMIKSLKITLNLPEIKKKMSESKRGKSRSEEIKIKISKNSYRRGKPPAPSSSYGHGSYYESPLQGKIWLRSTYELAYAKYLDSKNILWYYEIETFDLGDMTYTPDFFLPRYDKFIEIKGYMRKEAKEKIDKFLEQYPWDLNILFKEDLIKLGLKI